MRLCNAACRRSAASVRSTSLRHVARTRVGLPVFNLRSPAMEGARPATFSSMNIQSGRRRSKTSRTVSYSGRAPCPIPPRKMKPPGRTSVLSMTTGRLSALRPPAAWCRIQKTGEFVSMLAQIVVEQGDLGDKRLDRGHAPARLDREGDTEAEVPLLKGRGLETKIELKLMSAADMERPVLGARIIEDVARRPTLKTEHAFPQLLQTADRPVTRAVVDLTHDLFQPRHHLSPRSAAASVSIVSISSLVVDAAIPAAASPERQMAIRPS